MLGGDGRWRARTAVAAVAICVATALGVAGPLDPAARPAAADTAPDPTASSSAPTDPATGSTTDPGTAADTPVSTDPASPAVTPDPSPAPTTSAPVSDPTPSATDSPQPSATDSPQPSPSDAQLAVALPADALLTLPAGDGLRDAVDATVTSPVADPVTLTASSAGRTVVIAPSAPLTAGPTGATGRITIPVTALTAGSWSVHVEQDGDGADASSPLVVGSGVVRTLALTTDRPAYYPRSPGSPSRVGLAVQAEDETGALLPVTGTASITGASGRRTTALAGGTPTTAALSVAGLTGTGATVRIDVRGPAGTRRTLSRTVRLAPTTTTRADLARSWPIVQPVVDDQLDAVTFTASAVSSSGVGIPVTGSLTIARAGVVARRWTVTRSTPMRFVWDGRVHGRIVAGTYAVTLTERGPDGGTRTTRTTVDVSTAHLPYRIRTIARLRPGNQQGLAIGRVGGATRVFTGVDVGHGNARIDEYDLNGRYVRSSGALPLGHAAELAITGGLLAVANGSPSAPTRITFVDASTWRVVRVVDAAALGVNGMIAADPAGGFLVFAGTSGAYTITPMGKDGALGASVPVPDEGVPQGLEVVHHQWWLFSSLVRGNRITKIEPGTGRVLDTIELAMPGEGEGEAIDPASGLVYVGCHSPNRFGVLERVVAR